MIIGSFNVRRGGNTLKIRRISDIIKKGEANIFLIQETKLTNLNELLAKSLWSNIEIGYSFSNSVGMSGGMISLWKVVVWRLFIVSKLKGF